MKYLRNNYLFHFLYSLKIFVYDLGLIIQRLKKLKKLVKKLKVTEEVNKRQIAKLEHDKSDLTDKTARTSSCNEIERFKDKMRANHYVADETTKKVAKDPRALPRSKIPQDKQTISEITSSSASPVVENRSLDQKAPKINREENSCLAKKRKQLEPLPAIPTGENTSSGTSKTILHPNKKTQKQNISAVDLRSLEDTVGDIAARRKDAGRVLRNKNRVQIGAGDFESEMYVEEKQVKSNEEKNKEELKKRIASIIASDFDI